MDGVWVPLKGGIRRYRELLGAQEMQQYMGVLEEVVRKGIDDGSFAANINVRVFRNMFLGGFTHMVIRWVFLSNGMS